MLYPKSAKLVRDIRINTGQSYQSMSDELAVSPSCIYYWEAGRKQPSLRNIKKLVDYAKDHQKELTVKVKVEDFLN